jgi:hypothetical protein
MKLGPVNRGTYTVKYQGTVNRGFTVYYISVHTNLTLSNNADHVKNMAELKIGYRHFASAEVSFVITALISIAKIIIEYPLWES